MAPVTSRGRSRHVLALLVPPDAVALEVAVAQQVFGRPTRVLANAVPSPYELVLCGARRRERLPSGVDFGDLAPLSVLREADTVLVPGVEDPLARREDLVLASLRAAHAAGARIASFCGGAFVLGRAGLLDGRRATTHWLLSAEFRREFPLARLAAEHLHVQDGRVHTSGGVLAAVDLSLHLLAQDLGQAHANDVSRLLVTPPRRHGGQSQYVKPALRRQEDPLSGLLTWLRAHLHQPLTLAVIAAHAHLGERTLVRRFRQATGLTVLDWLNQERVAAARDLLETTDHPVAQIAAMVGFGSTETLRRNFDRHTGTTATAYRATFRAGG
ncbi:transcriptional regulator GlxA family with amidase domain [Crossiella equi]|uniref:Transcriptional regulator GlxA family with amidase domain n=1 Tax=Crossiella equi TaxID=130796 RepID=A0ABS5ABI0_9PSEU|nr:helix-turn-helix domain-containing protein [Crossiella equi]MBP2473948.1 transcriptional regulator GlxA family with amidase domain [Crossiella equi]